LDVLDGSNDATELHDAPQKSRPGPHQVMDSRRQFDSGPAQSLRILTSSFAPQRPTQWEPHCRAKLGSLPCSLGRQPDGPGFGDVPGPFLINAGRGRSACTAPCNLHSGSAATMFNVSERTVKTAKQVADHATPCPTGPVRNRRRGLLDSTHAPKTD
jgi:hypothetical protein